MEKSIEQLAQWALATANPELPASQRATASWPVMKLEDALWWCGVYAIIVIAGLARMAIQGKKAENSTVDALVKPMQVLYNTFQVRYLPHDAINCISGHP